MRSCPISCRALAFMLAFLAPLSWAADKGLARVSLDEKRVALVIGNKDYADKPLQNPLNDARDMRAALEGLGFTVVYRENADLAQMDEAMREFTRQLGKDSVGLFYYSGHGLQVDGINYLVPIGASIASKAEVKSRAYDANIALGNIEDAGARVGVVVLDACRNSPLRGYRSTTGGLAQMGGGAGSIIAFATAPGETAEDGKGRNGTFTQHLLAHLRDPGVSAIDALQRVQTEVADETSNSQKPWINFGPQRGRFCFAGCGSSSVRPQPEPTPPTVTAPDSSQVELAFWNTIKNSADPADFQAYLVKFPQGQFQDLARNRIDRLKKVSQPLAKTPPSQPATFAANAYVCNLDPYGDNFLSLRTGPKSSYPEILRLGSRTRLAVLETRASWLHVRLSNGADSWVFSEYICRGIF